MKAIQIGEMIHVARSGVAQTPLEFHWRGRRHRVVRVQERPGSRARARKTTAGRQLSLRTSNGMRCHIWQDRVGSGWWLESIEQDAKEG